MTDNFYTELTAFHNFKDATIASNYKPMPEGWSIIITDVKGSTKAIEAGRYKDVNTVGAICIVALLNVTGKTEIPFVFGGDGATLLIPNSLAAKSKEALIATRRMAKSAFDLELRIAIVPIEVVYEKGHAISVAKLEVSPNYSQAMFTGSGLAFAESLVKSPETTQRDSIPETTDPAEADYGGYECRWKDIPSAYGESISLLVQAVSEKAGESDRIYRDAITQVETIYGDEKKRHPVTKRNLKLTFDAERLKSEAKVFAEKTIAKLRFSNFLGWLFMKLNIKTGTTEWGKYQDYVIEATDFQKIDGVLRMIISGYAGQREKLEAYLEGEYRKGKLVYGIHVSGGVLMTCLVFQRNGKQVHFIDGSNGGYALAAKAMKARLKTLKP
jgi:hypothetical protein